MFTYEQQTIKTAQSTEEWESMPKKWKKDKWSEKTVSQKDQWVIHVKAIRQLSKLWKNGRGD